MSRLLSGVFSFGRVPGACLIAFAIGVPGASAQEAEELPPVVVEGATLAAPKVKAKPKQQLSGPAVPQQSAAPAESSEAGPVTGEPSATPAASPSGSGTSNDGIAIDRLGSAVSVVTGQQLRSRQIRHAADALRSLPGVAVSRTGSAGGLTQVRIRGAEGNHTLVLIDGIEANDSTNGEFDFSDLSAEDIERIEVIRGPQSSLYGSGAIGGVVNIVTRGGRGPLTVSGRAEGGSFETQGGAARVSGGNDNIHGAVSIEKIKTDGFNISPFGKEEDGSELSTLSIKGGVVLLPGVSLDLVMRHTNKTGDRDSDDAVLGKLVEQTNDAASFDANIWLGGATLRWDTAGGALTHRLKATRNSTDRGDTGDLNSAFPFEAQNDGETVRYSYDATARLDTPGVPAFRHVFTGLVEEETERFTPLSDFADGIERERKRVSSAGEWRGEVADRLFLTAGIRHDDSDTFERFTTWRTTATIRVPELGVRPHASAGTGVKFPTLFEQFGVIPGFFTPNPDLKPEESLGWDAGIELSSADRAVVLDVTYFEADLTNRINGLAPGPNFTFTAVNTPGESQRDGVEAAASLLLLPNLSLSGAYTYLMAEDANGLDELRRPGHTGRADLHYAFGGGKGEVSLGAVYNGEMDDAVRRVTGFSFGFPILTPERFTLDEYWVVNAAGSYEVSPGVQLFGRVENVLDEDYQEVFGFETAGAAAFAGVRVKFEEP